MAVRSSAWLCTLRGEFILRYRVLGEYLYVLYSCEYCIEVGVVILVMNNRTADVPAIRVDVVVTFVLA